MFRNFELNRNKNKYFENSSPCIPLQSSPMISFNNFNNSSTDGNKILVYPNKSKDEQVLTQFHNEIEYYRPLDIFEDFNSLNLFFPDKNDINQIDEQNKNIALISNKSTNEKSRIAEGYSELNKNIFKVVIREHLEEGNGRKRGKKIN